MSFTKVRFLRPILASCWKTSCAQSLPSSCVLANSSALGVAATFILGVPVAGTLFLRLAVKLPSIAVGRSDFSLRDAWRATGGNNLPILLLFVLNLLAGVGAIFGVLLTVFFPIFGLVAGAGGGALDAAG